MKTYDFSRPHITNFSLYGEGRLCDQVNQWLNTHLGTHTIPQIAKALVADEHEVADVLGELCELSTPDVLIDSKGGEDYFQRCNELRWKGPKKFTDKTTFYGFNVR